MDVNATTVWVAALSSGGGALIIREVLAGLLKISKGWGIRTATVRDDLVLRAETAEKREREAVARADAADLKWRRSDNRVAGLERIIILNGWQGQVPPPIDYDKTLTAQEVREIRSTINQEGSNEP